MPALSYDHLLENYLELCGHIKQLEDDRELMKLQILQMLDDGEESAAYAVSRKEVTSERVAALRAIRDRSPSLFDQLRAVGLVTESVSTRLTVKPR